MNIYWDDLQGEKHVRYVPNAGHGLDDGKEGALMTLAAFAQHVAEDKPLPELTYSNDTARGKRSLKLKSTVKPTEVRLWVARSESMDFRKSKWESSPMKAESDSFTAEVTEPEQGGIAWFCEAVFAGPIGTGETHLAVVLGIEAARRVGTSPSDARLTSCAR